MKLVDFLQEHGAYFNTRSGLYVLEVTLPEYRGLFKIGSAVSLTRRLLAYATAFRPLLSAVRVKAILVKRRDYLSIVDTKRISAVYAAECRLHGAYKPLPLRKEGVCSTREWCPAEWRELRNRLITYHNGSSNGRIEADGHPCRAYLYYTSEDTEAADPVVPWEARGDARLLRPAYRPVDPVARRKATLAERQALCLAEQATDSEASPWDSE
jgi:hypothetical protein